MEQYKNYDKKGVALPDVADVVGLVVVEKECLCFFFVFFVSFKTRLHLG